MIGGHLANTRTMVNARGLLSVLNGMDQLFRIVQILLRFAADFETSERSEVLSFNHHRAIAKLKPERRQELLDWCKEPLKNGGTRPRSIRELHD